MRLPDETMSIMMLREKLRYPFWVIGGKSCLMQNITKTTHNFKTPKSIGGEDKKNTQTG